MSLSCPRCGESLQAIENATPGFCPHCGLPQLRISPEALASPSSATEAGTENLAAEWGRALWIVAVLAVTGVGLPSLLPGAVVSGVVAGIDLLLMPVLAMLAVFGYSRSRPPRTLAPTEGGTLGALLGAMMGFLLAFVTGVTGFVLRYIRHSHAMDDRIGQAAAQLPAQLSAAGAVPADVLGLVQSPEFRAGTFILSHVFSMLLLIAVGSLCGWAGGTVLRQRRQRAIGKA